MKVKTIQTFEDLQENTLRHEDDIFECDLERANKLEKLKLVIIIGETKEDKELIKEETNEPKKTSKSSKKGKKKK
jgi:hypothetical protein